MSISLLQKAHQYLLLRNFVEQNGQRKLIYFQKSFWTYENGKWRKISVESMVSDVIKLANEEGFLDDTRQSMVRDLVRNLQAISSINLLEIGSFIGTTKPHNTHYIPLQNGILKIKSENNKITHELSELTPDFFSTSVLPYRYDPNATCNIFLKFLSEILSPDEIKFIRQWIGYCLIPVTFAEKFLIAFGNGQTVNQFFF